FSALCLLLPRFWNLVLRRDVLLRRRDVPFSELELDFYRLTGCKVSVSVRFDRCTISEALYLTRDLRPIFCGAAVPVNQSRQISNRGTRARASHYLSSSGC